MVVAQPDHVRAATNCLAWLESANFSDGLATSHANIESDARLIHKHCRLDPALYIINLLRGVYTCIQADQENSKTQNRSGSTL